jgi:hypothetical protein
MQTFNTDIPTFNTAVPTFSTAVTSTMEITEEDVTLTQVLSAMKATRPMRQNCLGTSSSSWLYHRRRMGKHLSRVLLSHIYIVAELASSIYMFCCI